MRQFECQIFQKAKKLVKRKHAAVREFQNLLLEDEYMDLIAAIEQHEEDLSDVLIFSPRESRKFYQDSIFGEIHDLEEFKKRIVSKYEYKIIEYGGMTQEEAFVELEDLIEA